MKKIKIMLFAFICFFAVGIYNVNADVFVGGGKALENGKMYSGNKTGTISWDNTNKVLTLDNYNTGFYIPSGDSVIHIYDSGDVTIILKGENNIRTAEAEGWGWGMGILAENANLTIKSDSSGVGTLKVNGGEYAIKAKSLNFDNVNINIIANSKIFNVTPTFTNLGNNNSVFVSENQKGESASYVDLTAGKTLTNYKSIVTAESRTITVDADDNSNVSLAKTTVVKKGDSVEVTITAKEDYKLKSVLVDGKDLTLKENKATLTVDEDTEIKVSSVAINDIDVASPTVDTSKEVEEVTIGVKADDALNEIFKKAMEKQTIAVADATNVEVAISNLDAATVPVAAKEEITKLLKEKDLTLGNYFDITINVKNRDTEIINTLTELDKKITFQVALPSELLNTNKSVKRTYYVVRYHDGEVEILNATLSDENVLTFASDKFSTYAIAYIDTAIDDTTDNTDNTATTTEANKTTSSKITNPDTSDNVLTHVLLAVLSGVGIVGSSLIYRKKLN